VALLLPVLAQVLATALAIVVLLLPTQVQVFAQVQVPVLVLAPTSVVLPLPVSTQVQVMATMTLPTALMRVRVWLSAVLVSPAAPSPARDCSVQNTDQNCCYSPSLPLVQLDLQRLHWTVPNYNPNQKCWAVLISRHWLLDL
jgi:hypothetical protein